jgi:hypothetical protein
LAVVQEVEAMVVKVAVAAAAAQEAIFLHQAHI